MQQHVRVLVLRALGAVALGVRVGGDVEGVVLDDLVDVVADIVENCGSTSFSTSCPSKSDHISPTVSSPTRVTTPPMSWKIASVARRFSHQSFWVWGKLETNRVVLAAVIVGHDMFGLRIVLHVVDAGADVDQRLELRMLRHVLHALAADIDLAAVADRVAVLVSGPDHGSGSFV